MLDELSIVEKFVKEFMIKLMTKRFMSIYTGVQASSTRGIPASSSTTCGARPCRPSYEKRTKNKDDLLNSKLILTILPTYIPPLSGAVNRDSVPRDFKYTLVMVYLLKGICSLSRPR
jgi:hypothetical protein